MRRTFTATIVLDAESDWDFPTDDELAEPLQDVAQGACDASPSAKLVGRVTVSSTDGPEA